MNIIIINQSTVGVANCPLSGVIIYCEFAFGEKTMFVIRGVVRCPLFRDS